MIPACGIVVLPDFSLLSPSVDSLKGNLPTCVADAETQIRYALANTYPDFVQLALSFGRVPGGNRSPHVDSNKKKKVLTSCIPPWASKLQAPGTRSGSEVAFSMLHAGAIQRTKKITTIQRAHQRATPRISSQLPHPSTLSRHHNPPLPKTINFVKQWAARSLLG